MTYTEIMNVKRFGSVTYLNCDFYLNDLIKPEEHMLPADANKFFELYLLDAEKNLIDVPVLMRDYRLIDGSQPNVGLEVLETWKFVRRFFIYDTLSGIDQQNGYVSGKTPSYIRWASKI